MPDSLRIRREIELRLGKAPPGSRLPSDTAIADSLDVARSAVSRVMSQLARESLCTRVHGSGTYAPGSQNTPGRVRIAQNLTAAESVAAHLREEISRGAVRIGGAMPPIKALCLDLGVSPTTASSAYRLLQSEGLVTKAGKTFRARHRFCP